MNREVPEEVKIFLDTLRERNEARITEDWCDLFLTKEEYESMI